jgi:hypothetical protein
MYLNHLANLRCKMHGRRRIESRRRINLSGSNVHQLAPYLALNRRIKRVAPLFPFVVRPVPVTVSGLVHRANHVVTVIVVPGAASSQAEPAPCVNVAGSVVPVGPGAGPPIYCSPPIPQVMPTES